MAYFGTNGVRGRFNELTPELAQRLAQQIGIYLKKSGAKGKSGKIILARDCRLTGEVLSSSVAAGLASVGCDVVDLGVASSPTAEFMIKKLGACGCVMITASHNPPEWNAIKVVDSNGVAVSRERGGEIEKTGIKLAPWDGIGKITRYELAGREHMDVIKSLVDVEGIRKRRPKIVLDCGNGTASVIAPGLFKELGCEIISLNAHLDGRFPGRPSEPSEANVKELLIAVRTMKADAGIAWDADGDRVIFVDEKGGYVIGDRVFALSVLWRLVSCKGDVVTTVATSKAVEDVAAKNGCKVRYTAIGAPALCEEMARKPAAIGGEEVGGVIWPQLSMAKDGLMTGAMLAQALCEKPLSAWLKDIPLYYNVKLKIEADAKGRKEIMSRVLAFAKKSKLDYITLDGVRVNMKDAWVIVRPSGTEDYVRVFAEARSEGDAKKLASEYEKVARG